jgi:hypothetical protein
MREHNKDIYNYIFNTTKNEGISEPFLLEALDQFKKQKEALEYIRDNNLTKDYDEVVLKYLSKKNKSTN